MRLGFGWRRGFGVVGKPVLRVDQPIALSAGGCSGLGDAKFGGRLLQTSGRALVCFEVDRVANAWDGGFSG